MEQQQTLYEVRNKICKFCTSYNLIMDTCQQTDKIITIYSKKLINQCPIKKWPQ